MKKLFIFFIFAYLAFTLFALVASAKIEYPFGGLSGSNVTPADYFRALYIWGLGMIAAMAVTGIAAGGFMYMVGKVDQGKEIITSSLLGLLLLMGAWLILYTINPNLATLKNPTLEAPGTPPQNKQTITGPPNTPTAPDNKLDFDPEISSQQSDESSALQSFLGCMAQKLPGNVGRVSSISDSAGMAKCTTNYSKPPCAHAATSCHYGGSGSCKGKSYAADFGDENNGDVIMSTAKSCNSSAYTLYEGNHVHVSVGNASGCGCN